MQRIVIFRQARQERRQILSIVSSGLQPPRDYKSQHTLATTGPLVAPNRSNLVSLNPRLVRCLESLRILPSPSPLHKT